jgi:hypothetical protein
VPDLLAAEDVNALGVARTLVTAGVPVFVASPCDCPPGKLRWPTCKTGYHLPAKWQTTTTSGNQVDRWKPGWALCAVMGHVCDLVDVDPRNGGDATAQALKAAGSWPRSYGRAATPSGGTHDLVAPLHVGSHDGVQPGLDVKGGRPDGTGRGFAFIAPTRKPSKVTGERLPYRWLEEPDLSDTEGDDTGAHLAELVDQARPAAGRAGLPRLRR